MTPKNSKPAPDVSHRPQAVFLERQSFRRRRLVDMARLLPLLGVLLLLLPLLWPGSDPAGPDDGGTSPVLMSDAITYIFLVWGALIVGAVAFGIGARRWGGDERRSEPGRD